MQPIIRPKLVTKMPLKQEQKQYRNPWENHNNNNNIALQSSAVEPEHKTQQKWSDITEEENVINNNNLHTIPKSPATNIKSEKQLVDSASAVELPLFHLDVSAPTLMRMNRRRQISKFGDESGKPMRGGQYNSSSTRDEKTGNIISLRPIQNISKQEEHIPVTSFGPEFELKLYPHLKGSEETTVKVSTIVKCKNCGLSGHFTSKCDKPSITATPAQPQFLDSWTAQQQSEYARNLNKQLTIRNLSGEVEKCDLEELCARFGRIVRINFSYNKDRAYVTFDSESAAGRAEKRLNGHLYDNLVLDVTRSNTNTNTSFNSAQNNNTSSTRNNKVEEEAEFIAIR